MPLEGEIEIKIWALNYLLGARSLFFSLRALVGRFVDVLSFFFFELGFFFARFFDLGGFWES